MKDIQSLDAFQASKLNEAHWTGKDDANTFRELGKREQLQKLAEFLEPKMKDDHPYADGGSCVVVQETEEQPASIQKHVDEFNKKFGSSYKVKPGEGRKEGDGDPKFVIESMTERDAIDETVIMKASAPKFDVTTSAKSIAARVTDLIGRMNAMSMEAIRDEFKMILTSGDTHASDPTRRKWLDIASNARNKFSLMKSITDLYLAAANMKVDPNSY